MTKILKHEHLIVRAEVENPPKDPEYMNAWMENMVKEIGMEILMGPWSIYSEMVGNRGLTSSVILSTSHAVTHTWDEISPALIEIDVYSCSDLDPHKILDLIQEFKPVKEEWLFLDRESTIKVIDHNLENGKV